MYENTTYKAFVAETAAKIAAEISGKFVTAQDTSLLAKDEATQHNIAVASISVADKLAELSTVTRGDAYAILKNLGSVMASYMASGRTVKLEGVGTFYYSLTAAKQGVDTAEEVSANQITAVRVRFIPEVTRNPSSQVSTRSLMNNELFWMEWAKDDSKKKENSGNESNENGSNEGGNEGDDELDPLG